MRMRAVTLALAALTLAGVATGCTSERQKCMTAVTQEFMDADKVSQQPIDLAGFCELWHNHPPGIDDPNGPT